MTVSRRRRIRVAATAVGVIALIVGGLALAFHHGRSTSARSQQPPTAPAPTVNTGLPLGFFSDVQYLSGAALQSSIDAQKAAGATWVRFQLIWPNIETSPGRYHWARTDAVVTAITAAGMKPLPVAGDTPSWAFPGAMYPPGCSQHVCGPNTVAIDQRFARFVAAATARYAGRISAVEVWNEANNPLFWQPAPNAASYTALLKATYLAVKAVTPGVTVISSGLAPSASRDRLLGPVAFLGSMYADGGRGFFDAVGWHPYTWPFDPSRNDPDLSWFQMSHDVRALMTDNGDSGKQIWATEFGAPTCTGSGRCVAQSVQASQLNSALHMWQSYPWAGPMIVYAPFDTCADQADPQCFFGVMTAGKQPKPALSVFTRYATGG